MTTEANSPTNLDLFRKKVASARRQTGRLQKELADALGIDAQVLSRKMHGAKQTFPTHAEVRQIIKVLATWEAITTRDEAIGRPLYMNGLARFTAALDMGCTVIRV